jgi:hypothetical protein
MPSTSADAARAGGLRLHLVATLSGLPIAFALTGAKADERQTLLNILQTESGLITDRPGQTLIGDRHYYGKRFEHALTEASVTLLRPARKGEPERAAPRCSSHYARPSNRSTKPSKPNSTWNDTADAPPAA